MDAMFTEARQWHLLRDVDVSVSQSWVRGQIIYCSIVSLAPLMPRANH